MNREAYGILVGLIVLMVILLPKELFLFSLMVLSFLISRELSAVLEVEFIPLISPLLLVVAIYESTLFLPLVSLTALYYGYREWSLYLFLKTFFLCFYPAYFLSFLYPVKELGTEFLLVYIFSLWINDVLAYYVGKRWGSTPLFPKLSPKKTLEGFFGGYLPAVAFSVVFLPFNPIYNVLIGGITILMGVVGDYFKSFIKRQLGIKDFSNVLGEHGGFTDRFDDVVFAAPVYYLFIRSAW